MSLPPFYIILHGQVHILILAGVLSPLEYLWVIAVTKPQVAVGILFDIVWSKLPKEVARLSCLFLITFLIFRNWVSPILNQPKPFIDQSHNLWLRLRPFQVPFGVLILVYGIRKKDERYKLLSSPFLMPYASISSLLGPWLAILSVLENRLSFLVLLSWWGAVIYRIL